MDKAAKVLVTGGSGFLGSRVVRALQAHGFTYVDVLHSSQYDLTEQSSVRAAIKNFNPGAIIHLAAVVGGIGANMKNPGRYFYSNAMMGIMLMEEARLAGVTKFLTVGTICSYPKFANIPFREEELWDGYPEETNAPYGLAKKMLLVQSQAYRDQYGFNAIYLMPTNLYGPGDNFDLETSHVIPAMIWKFLDAKERNLPSVVLWGDGSPTREFLYVDDAARGILMALEGYDGREPVNLGSGEERSIREIAETIRTVVGYNGQIEWDTSKPNGQPRRKLDTSRARDLFGFEAKTTLSEGISNTFEWYQSARHVHA